MTALVSQYRFEGKVVGIRIALKRLGVNGQQVLVRRASAAVLRATGLAVYVSVLDAPDKAQCSSDAGNSIAAGTLLAGGEWPWRSNPHERIQDRFVGQTLRAHGRIARSPAITPRRFYSASAVRGKPAAEWSVLYAFQSAKPPQSRFAAGEVRPLIRHNSQRNPETIVGQLHARRQLAVGFFVL